MRTFFRWGLFFAALYGAHHVLITQGKLLATFDRHPQWKATPSVTFYGGRWEELWGRWDVAQELYQRVVDRYPKHPLAPEAQFSVAFMYERQKNFQKAVAEYKKLNEKYPKNINFSIADRNIDLLSH